MRYIYIYIYIFIYIYIVLFIYLFIYLFINSFWGHFQAILVEQTSNIRGLRRKRGAPHGLSLAELNIRQTMAEQWMPQMDSLASF